MIKQLSALKIYRVTGEGRMCLCVCGGDLSKEVSASAIFIFGSTCVVHIFDICNSNLNTLMKQGPIETQTLELF